MRRLLCLVLAAVCALTAIGCSPQEAVSSPSSSTPLTDAQQDSPRVFAISYSREDTLNPYTATTEVNLSLAGLLFDSLTVVDAAFTPQLSLAASVTATDATHLTVKLRDGAVFSDGTAVALTDVTGSFEAAKKSQNYDELLTNVVSATINRRTDEIIFTLATGVPNAAACLSFPVMKVSTATTAAGAAPLGGGVYVYTVGDTGAYLAANAQWADKPRYTKVQLRDLPNVQSMYYGLASGNITYYYNDLNTGDIPRVTGASAKVNMNALVYLGMNSANPALSQPAVRQALSLLIDRTSLAANAFAGWALPADKPFHPAWCVSEKLEPVTGMGAQDLSGAVKKLQGSGQKKLKLELIYSLDSGNRGTLVDMVRTQLESAGIQMTVTPLAYEEYMARLRNGQYDLYVGEIRLAANMDLNPLLGGGEAHYGVAADDAAALAYRQYCDATGTLEAFFTAFGESMPYIPLCWRCGFSAYDRRLTTVTPHGYAPYYGIGNWH